MGSRFAGGQRRAIPGFWEQGREVDIVAKLREAHDFERRRFRDRGETEALDGADCVLAAKDAWGDEDFEGVDFLGVEEVAEGFASAFEKDVGPAACAEILEQAGDGKRRLDRGEVEQLAPSILEGLDGRRGRSPGRDDDGDFARGASEMTIGAKPRGGVEDDAGGDTGAGRSRGEAWVVGEGGSDTDHDGVHASAQLVDERAGAFIADPAAVSGAGCELAVEGHCPFRGDVRAAGGEAFEVRGVEAARVGFEEAAFDGDSRVGELSEASAVNLGEGIAHGGDDAFDSGLNDGLDAGRGFSLVAAGFEGDVEGCSPGGFACEIEGVDLGVGRAEASVIAGADEVVTARDHGADEGIWLDMAEAAVGFGEGALHPEGIGVGPGERIGGHRVD